MEANRDLILLTQTLEMISLATTKGFGWSLSIHPVMFEHWMPFQEAFCNQACSVVSWWLRDKHNVDICISHARNQFPRLYKWYALYYNSAGEMVFDTMADEYEVYYELTWLNAINYALNKLP